MSVKKVELMYTGNEHEFYRQGFDLCKYGDYMYIYGGRYRMKIYFKNLWKIHVKTFKCTEMTPLSSVNPSDSIGGSLNCWNNCLYLFGGYIKNYGQSNSLWKYDINGNSWTLIKSNNKPPQSQFHKCCVYKHYLVLFGGIAQQNGWVGYNTIYLFDTINETWKCMEVNNKPKERYGHGMTIYNEYLIISAGKHADGSCINDSYYININDVINNNSPIWIPIDLSNINFNFHFLLTYDYKLMCFGGRNNNGKRNNDLIIFYNIDGMISPSKVHVMRSYIKRISIQYNLNIPNEICNLIEYFYGTLYKRIKCGDIKERTQHRGSILNIQNKDVLFIHGGFNKGTLGDTFLIELNV